MIVRRALRPNRVDVRGGLREVLTPWQLMVRLATFVGA